MLVLVRTIAFCKGVLQYYTAYLVQYSYQMTALGVFVCSPRLTLQGYLR